MKKYLFIALILGWQISMAQTGINTDDPKVNLHVKADLTNSNNVEGIISPILSGNDLKGKDALYTANQIGTIVYVTSATSPTSTKTQLVTEAGYYYFDGSIWRAFGDDIEIVNDATRFLGGTIYVRFQSNSINNGSNFDDLIIGTLPDGKYQIGTATESPNRGGIVSVKGNGYTISNPSSGVFDIQFDVPFESIYGISTNILDAYGQPNSGVTTTGDYPVFDTPGGSLKTTDNTQVAFISNSIIRVKTGDQYGIFSNRPFTFLVTGQ